MTSEPNYVRSFRELGYCVYDQPVFDTETFEQLKSHFDSRLLLWNQKMNRTPEHMDKAHFSDPALFRWLFHSKMMEILQPIIGENIGLWASHFVCKPPGTGKRVPWHEDSAHWGPIFDPMEVVTVWLAIDKATVSNGCLRVIPGSHRQGESRYTLVPNPGEQFSDREIEVGSFDTSEAVDIELLPNQCSIHHAKLIHGSNANLSNTRRCGYTMRYFPTSSRYIKDRHSREGFEVYLAKGRDIAGNHYGKPFCVNEAWLASHPDDRIWADVIKNSQQTT